MLKYRHRQLFSKYFLVRVKNKFRPYIILFFYIYLKFFRTKLMNSFSWNIVIICILKCQIKKVLKYKDFIEIDAKEGGGGVLDVRDRHSHSVSDIEPAWSAHLVCVWIDYFIIPRISVGLHKKCTEWVFIYHLTCFTCFNYIFLLCIWRKAHGNANDYWICLCNSLLLS